MMIFPTRSRRLSGRSKQREKKNIYIYISSAKNEKGRNKQRSAKERERERERRVFSMESLVNAQGKRLPEGFVLGE